MCYEVVYVQLGPRCTLRAVIMEVLVHCNLQCLSNEGQRSSVKGCKSTCEFKK